MVSPSAVWYTSLGFVRSGHITLYNGALWSFGFVGDGWSRTAASYGGSGSWDAIAYYLNATTSSVEAAVHYVRWLGLPVRCLV